MSQRIDDTNGYSTERTLHFMKERYILAYFNTPEQAKNIQQQLSSSPGITETSIDRIPLFQEPDISHSTNTISEAISRLTVLTTDTAPSQPDANVSTAAHSSASDISSSHSEKIRGRDILLTVAVNESNYHETLQFIRTAGGLV
jgi:hypothetical protein